MTILEAPLQQRLQEPRLLTRDQIDALRTAIRLVPITRLPQDLFLHLQHPGASHQRGEIRAAAFGMPDPTADFGLMIEAWRQAGKGRGAAPEEVLKVSVFDGGAEQGCYVNLREGDAFGWGDYGTEYGVAATGVHNFALEAIATWALWSSSHLSPTE